MIRIGVIGVGSLGQHHARNFTRIFDAKLVAIIDTDKARADLIARKIEYNFALNNKLYKFIDFFISIFPRKIFDFFRKKIILQNNFHIETFISYKDLIGKVDAVSIVSPTPLHYEIARFFLENNIHCLIEKPITTNIEEASVLIDIARKNNLVLQVGHIERFNPAIIELQNHISNPRYIEINRLGPYLKRASNVGVVLDLMVHDLDIVLFLIKSEIESVEAIGAKIITEYEDIANVHLKFKNGAVVNISASRVSFKKLRKIRIFEKDKYVSLNYEDKSFRIYTRTKKVEKLADINIFSFKGSDEEPLYLELVDFVDCVKNGKEPKVNGEHGKRALELALEVVNKVEGNYV